MTSMARGGVRMGAGRPRKRWAKEVDRPEFDAWQALHVTLRVDWVAVGRLRSRDCYHAVRKAMQAMLVRTDFRIAQVSLERDHIHMLVEAAHDRALADGMRGFMISAARRLNVQAGDAGTRARLVRTADGVRCIGALRAGRRGSVSMGPYHAVLIRSPYQARNALRYVLNNYLKHDEIEAGTWPVDYYSSGPTFRGWAEYATSQQPFPIHPEYQPLPVSPPRTWFLATGWRKAGPISLTDIPGRPRF
jgi:putative transposase